MPQLSSLPWLIFVVIRFLPVIFIILVRDLVFSGVRIVGSKVIKVVVLKW